MSTTKTPTIIPMHLSGFHQVMPEPRRFKFIPRPGHHITITFGDPTNLTKEANKLVQKWRRDRPTLDIIAPPPPVREAVENLGGELDTARLSGNVRRKATEDLKGIDWAGEERARADIVALLQRGVADLARTHRS
ncbi:hypothetical protein FRC10_004912 [Ceratobasidium sp. 414]|nr:hypothetical protein FRC10_004912 [Ceratobasidium sp. 414]